jgi:cyclopropane fatty-acyl-phospholipid synthase-like methyltransferase
LKYPLFDNPTAYLKFRRGTSVMGLLKRRGEQRALDRCLEGLDDVRTICDAPSGPGYLFHYWHKKGFHVTGVDLSEPTVAAAREEHRRHNLSGSILYGDVFRLKEFLKDPPDLVASIRFMYYLDREERMEFLRVVSAASRRYALIQYKTMETLRSRITLRRRRKRGKQPAKYFCSFRQIADEVEEAGMRCVRIVPISQFSDRVFVVAEK